MRIPSLLLSLVLLPLAGCGGRQVPTTPTFVEAWGSGGVTVEWLGLPFTVETFAEASGEGASASACFSVGPWEWCRAFEEGLPVGEPAPRRRR